MDTLLTDLFKAYYDARRNKRNTPSQLRFELKLESNLIELYHELRDRRYRPSPSVCFIVQDSVKREVFASDFRDRVVHHLYYNYVSELFDRQFVYDSYSCRKGKGTLLGIERLQHHIKSVTHNYTREAYILKMDIHGYFMSINRTKLREMVYEMVDRVHLSEQIRDFVYYLTDIITMKDPMLEAKIRGNTMPFAYLGAVVRPFYRHCSSKTMRKYLRYKRFYINLCQKSGMDTQVDVFKCLSSMNSYKGYLSHFKASKCMLDM